METFKKVSGRFRFNAKLPETFERFLICLKLKISETTTVFVKLSCEICDIF